MDSALTSGRRERLHGVDVLRGLVMVLMALDHCRDYFGDIRLAPEDVASTTPALFFTRWVTHFCAPVFVLLAGVSADLWGAGRRRAEVARFLASRGLWLIVLEFTLVYWTWMMTFQVGIHLLQVIAAIGVAMVVLSGLVFLPRRLLLVVALGIVCGHDAVRGIDPSDFVGADEPTNARAFTWALGFEPQAFLPLSPGRYLLVIYPLVPWVGVLALGYALGPWFRRARAERRRLLWTAGLGLCALFLVLRGLQLYGEPQPWSSQDTPLMTLVSFLNCSKYPPSLQYLAMTLGPALCLLAALDREPGRVGRWLQAFGRVPLFYYVLHMLVIHLGARLMYLVQDGHFLSPMQTAFTRMPDDYPAYFGRGLGTVYVAWIGVVLALQLPCRWYADVKRRSRSRLLSYL